MYHINEVVVFCETKAEGGHKPVRLGYTLTTMALKIPLPSVLAGLRLTTPTQAPRTFGEERSVQLNQRLNRALRERRTWKAVENTAAAPIDSTAQAKGEQTARSIDRLLHEIKEAESA
jgi:hypothetical protein